MSEQNTESAASDRVVCPAAFETLLRYFVGAAGALGFGALCAKDAITGKYADVPANHWFNVIGAVVLIPAGLVLLGLGIRAISRKLVADAEGVGYEGKSTIPWSAVTRLVIRGKGLMDLHYKTGDDENVLKLDSLKIKNFDKMVQLIEAKCPNTPVETVEKKS